MSKLNRFEVAKVIGELPSATDAAIREALGPDVDGEIVKKKLDSAAQHGLITRGAGENGATTWEISDKGKRKVADKT